MSLNQYFDSELDYLRKLNKDVALEKPHLITFLTEKSADPDVIRLLEGFAYLSGDLRTQIDRQFPELTNSLVNMLWPNYSRPFPSLTMMEYQPDLINQKSATLIPSDQLFLSDPIYVEEGQETKNPSIEQYHQCQFTQCRDLWLIPAKVANISSSSHSLTLTFRLNEPLPLATIGLEKLRFYLHGSNYTTSQLFYLLAHAISSASLVTDKHTLELPNVSIKPVGFEREEALLPYPKNSYDGYRLLQEYFCFPEAFLFLDVYGLDDIPPVVTAQEFSLNIQFSLPIPEAVLIQNSTIRINCVPAVNLFKMDSEAIELDGHKSDYPLRASHQYPNCYDIFSIEGVESLRTCSEMPSEPVRYTAFESFHHQKNQSEQTTHQFYRLKMQHAKNIEGFTHSLSFVRGNEHKLIDCKETISVALNCTNRDIASRLPVGSINTCLSTDKKCHSVTNIMKPSKALYPLLDHTLHWSILTNLALNYQSLLNLDSLKQILQLYDMPAIFHQQSARKSQKRLDALVKLVTRPIEHLYRGLPIRGLKTILSVSQRAFNSEGELYLFCSIIARFFSLYTSVNTFHELEVINLDNKETYHWPAQINQRKLK